MDQYLFFKENTHLNLFDANESRLQICNQFRVKLLCVSNQYGYVVAGFKNTVKILPIAQFENQPQEHEKFTKNYEITGLIQYADQNQVVYVQLNCLETHLIVLTCRHCNDNTYEYNLNIYDLQSIQFNTAGLNNQTPYCVNTINLKKDNFLILDLSLSPTEPDQLILNKSNGEIVLITKLFDKNVDMITKMGEATALTWSIKGKTVLACASQNRVFSYNHSDLKPKNCFNCTNKQLIATHIKSLSTKKFEIGYDLTENDRTEPVFTFTELSVDKNTNKEMISQQFYQSDFVYAMDTDYTPKVSAFYTCSITDWNLFFCAYSKCPDLCLMAKHNDQFNVLEIENFRCSLPLNTNDEEMFPLGFGVNYNTRKQIDFENFGNQPPSPLVLILTDTGFLTSFFAINRHTNQSICYESKGLQFKNDQKKVESQPKENTAPKFNTGSMQPSASMFGLNSNTAAQVPKTSQSTINFNQTPALKPQQQILSMLPNQAQQQPAFKMNIPPPAPQQQKPLPQFQPQPVVQQQPAPKVQLQQKLIQQEQYISTHEQIKMFNAQLNDFKQDVNKLFSGKDLSKCLLNLSVTKETKITEERFNKLKEETKSLSEECSNLLNKILLGFHDYENYKLQVKKLKEYKGFNPIANTDLDPHWKSKFDNIKKLYFFLQKELPNMDDYIREASKKKRDRISSTKPLHEIYENIRINNINIKQFDNKLNKIIEQLKYAKLGRTIFKDITLNLMTNSPRLKNETNRLDGENVAKNGSFLGDKPQLEDTELIDQLSQIKLKDDLHFDQEEFNQNLRLNSEKHAKFNSKLYSLLARRKKVPIREINLQKIQFLDSKFNEFKPTQINMNETSFLNLKTQSPLPARTQMPQLQQLSANIEQSPSAINKTVQFSQKTAEQPQFQMSSSLQGIQQQTKPQQFGFMQQQPQVQPQLQQQPKPVQQTQPIESPKQQPETVGLSAFQQPKQQLQPKPKPISTTSSPIPASQSQFSFTASPSSQPQAQTSLFKTATVTSSAAQSSGLNFSAKTDQTAPTSSLFGTNQLSTTGTVTQSSSMFSFNLGGQDSKASTQQQPSLFKSESQPSQLATSLFKTEQHTPQKTQQLPKPEPQTPEQQPKPTKDSLIKQSVDTVKSDLNKTVTITKEKEPVTAAKIAPVTTVPEPAKVVEPKREQVQTEAAAASISATAQSTSETTTKPMPSSSSNLSSLLSLPSSSATTPLAATSQPSTPFSFGLGNQSSSSTQMKPSFSFGSSLTSLPSSSQQTVTDKPAMTVSAQPVQAVAVQPVVPAAAPATTSFLFNQAQSKPTSFFSTGPKPNTSTPNHQATAAPTAAANQLTGTSLFSNFMPASSNPFTAVAAQSTPQKPAASQSEIDAEMESAANGAQQSFGSLGFGSTAPKPADQNKNIFGGATSSVSLFGGMSSQANASQQKSPFGNILKNPTFTLGQAQPQQASLFGAASATTGGGLFGSTTNASNQQQGGSGLFSSFKTPQKATGFGIAAPAFGGAAPAFGGAAPAFGGAAPAFGGAAPAFGGAATTSGFGSTGTFGSPPVFGGGVATSPTATTFGSAAGGSLFGGGGGAAANTNTGFGALAATTGGSTFGSFGQSNQNSQQMGFGNLAQQAQQQPQQNLFSSFGGGAQQNQGGFGNSSGSSFTTYRK